MDTACSSSLVAVHLAVQTLRSGESRVAVACGSNLLLGPENFIVESKLKMLSPDGRSKMWDRDANGYARGDGVAAVILKTLSQAIADGDSIDCVIRETGINQDGATTGITMPSSAAQKALILNTYQKAGLDIRAEADRPQYFEAHGTGESPTSLDSRKLFGMSSNSLSLSLPPSLFQVPQPVTQSRPKQSPRPSTGIRWNHDQEPSLCSWGPSRLCSATLRERLG